MGQRLSPTEPCKQKKGIERGRGLPPHIMLQHTVLKTGLNRSVQPLESGTGDESGWVNLLKPLVGQN